MSRLGLSSLRILGLLVLIIGSVVPSPVLAGQGTPEPQPKPQVFAFPLKANSPSLATARTRNQVAGSTSGASPSTMAAAGVDDRENTDPTGWYVYEHQTANDVFTMAINNNLRVVDLFVENPISPYQLTAVYVANTGSYAKTWWFFVDVDPTSLLNFAVTNNARITVLKAFNDPAPGGTVRFFAVLIANTGADQKLWWFYQGKTTTELTTLWQTNNARITQINSYVKNGVILYDAVMISNTGADNRTWYWWVNATVPDVITHLSQTGTRLTDMDIDSTTGNLNVIMTNCPGGCPLWWWYVGVPTSTLLNLANQNGARIIDANSIGGCGDRCWSFILINNSNAITSRVGQMLRNATDGTVGLYLKQVGGPVLANLMDSTVFEPASAIKAVTHLYTIRSIQAGSASLSTQITKYVPPVSGSCPGNTSNGTETIQIADQEMMWHSDNTRTRELNDFFGVNNVNLMANNVGLVHTSINHIIGCGGPIPNQTTLDDLGVLYEGVANGSLLDTAHKVMFFGNMAGKAQFQAEKYDWTHLWDTDIPAIIHQEAPSLPPAFTALFMSQMDLAYKAGNYNLCTDLTCSSLNYDIAIAGWAKIPFCDGSGLHEYVFGTFINNATNLTNASVAFNTTKAELLREQIHAGAASCASVYKYQYLPIARK